MPDQDQLEHSLPEQKCVALQFRSELRRKLLVELIWKFVAVCPLTSLQTSAVCVCVCVRERWVVLIFRFVVHNWHVYQSVFFNFIHLSNYMLWITVIEDKCVLFPSFIPEKSMNISDNVICKVVVNNKFQIHIFILLFSSTILQH